MTVLNPESKPQEPQVTAPAETNVSQVKSESNLPQQKLDNPHNSSSPDSPESAEDPNWRAFREARKKDRAEREAAEKKAAEKEHEIAALKAAMEAAFSKSAPTPQAYQNYYGMPEQQEETEEQRIERKVNEMLTKKQHQYEKERQEQEHKEYPQRLMKSYPDLNQVVSQENLDYLDYHYPEVSRPLQRLGDGYDKWSDIYQAIKKFVPNATNARREAAKADANFAKPKSISSTGLTQNTNSQDSARLTEDRKASNWQRMQQIMKGVS